MNTRIEEERECIRCDSTPVVDTAGYCVHCYWAVKAEVQEGLSQLGEYLRKRALFDNWCATHEAGA
jgi:hypothetical protein